MTTILNLNLTALCHCFGYLLTAQTAHSLTLCSECREVLQHTSNKVSRSIVSKVQGSRQSQCIIVN